MKKRAYHTWATGLLSLLALSNGAKAAGHLNTREPLNLINSISHSKAAQKPAEEPHILPTLPYLHVDGNIRSYFFERDFNAPNLPDQSAFSLGGKLNILTEDCLEGFQLGATLYTAQPLGINAHNPAKVDKTLPGNSVTTLGQAFVQYQNSYLLTRIGNQLITSPWINEADSRMIPASYQGFYAKIMPTASVNLTAMRLLRFKSRIRGGFSQTNLYSPINQGTPVMALGNQTVIGTLAFGVEYKKDNAKIQAWGYEFYDFAKLYYADASYKVETGTYINPIFGIQLGHEHNEGNPAFNRLNPVKANPNLFGALLGVEIAEGSLTLGYNNIPKKAGAFRNGDILSPYTSSYADPLYTTSMIVGLVEKAAGHAVKATAQYHFFEKQLSALMSYARYNTMPFIPNTNESNFDLTYTPNGEFKNISLRYRVGLLQNSPAFGRLVYQRVMFQYNFD